MIPEGFLGQLVSGFSAQGPALHVYTVTQAAAKPAGAVAGPFTTQAEAQAQATALNQGAAATPGNIASGAAAAASGTVLGPLFQASIWLRAGEVLFGVVLVAIAVNAMFKGKPLNVVAAPARLAAKAVP